MNPFFNIYDLLKICLRWRMHLIVVTLSSAILSAGFSFYIKPKYKSVAILYPANLVPYGTESTTEQMLQLLESEDIRDQLIDEFRLMEHYNIDSSAARYPVTVLREEMDEKISFDKTEYESVEITVYDHEPEVASRIANRIVALLDEKARALHRNKYAEVILVLEDRLSKKKTEMDSMENALNNIRINYGILNYSVQSDIQSREYIEALMGARNRGQLGEIKTVMGNLQQKGGEFISLNEHLWRVRGTYNDLKIQYENVKKDFDKELTFSNVVTRAFPAEKKSYPIRWLIVSMSVLSTFFISVLFLLLIENFKHMMNKFKEIQNQ